jgi:hypothetical protein
MIYIKCLIKDHQLTLNDSSDRCDSSKNYHCVLNGNWVNKRHSLWEISEGLKNS